ncbi:MFS transporter, partial [Enterobacter hormaechei]|nr:MFS transporter [Enterobacter hormaechei]
GIVALSQAERRFKRPTWTIIRLDGMQVPTFRVSLFGGALFRASISAVPFLLPLMFQVGFRIDAFHSGLLV